MGIAERWKRFAPLPSDMENRLERLGPLFAEEGVLLAYLFGSLGQGKQGADVDLAFLVQDTPRTARMGTSVPSSGAAFRLREPVCELLGTERLDLVDLRDAPPVLRFEILRTGRALYVADPEVQELFEMETIHLYRDTHYLRRQQREHLKEAFALWSSVQKRSMSG